MHNPYNQNLFENFIFDIKLASKENVKVTQKFYLIILHIDNI
jgi:hypothetical protein